MPPIAWSSIESDYTLSGHYGGFGIVDLEMVYITATVGGASIRNEDYVLIWVEIDNPNGANGAIEAFTCKTQYMQESDDFNPDTVSVETYDGFNMDFSTV